MVTDFGPVVPDTAERAVLADSVSLAVLVVLESLSPLERAVFVLREAFLFAVARDLGPDGEVRIVELNGGPAAVYFVEGRPDTVFQIEVSQGVIQCAYIIRNPDKLSGLPVA